MLPWRKWQLGSAHIRHKLEESTHRLEGCSSFLFHARPPFFFFFKWHLQAILPSSSWSSLSSSFCSFYSTVAPPHPMGCCSSKIQNNPLCVANHWGLVVVVTSVKVPRNNSGGFVGDLLLLCCCSLCFLLNGKVDNQVQMLFVKALLPIVCVCVCVLSVCA